MCKKAQRKNHPLAYAFATEELILTKERSLIPVPMGGKGLVKSTGGRLAMFMLANDGHSENSGTKWLASQELPFS